MKIEYRCNTCYFTGAQCVACRDFQRVNAERAKVNPFVTVFAPQSLHERMEHDA